MPPHPAIPRPRYPDPQTISHAAELLREGRLVAFPTETVYGLGADAGNPQALRRVFRAKGRPPTHPLIVHLAGSEQLSDWAAAVPQQARKLAEACWPGPLTMILKRRRGVDDQVTGGQDTVALRVPDHPIALALLQTFGAGIAAPSANRFGRISPTLARHVAEELGDRVSLILDGGPCAVGLESTILDLTGDHPTLLRPGVITAAKLERLLGAPVRLGAGGGLPRAPGRYARHYAPRTRAVLLREEQLADRIPAAGPNIGVIARRPPPASFPGCWMELPRHPEGYARRLYAALRELDDRGFDHILIEAVPTAPAWRALRDRLQRATTPEDASTGYVR